MEFEHWLVSPETKEQRNELHDIFSCIFSKEIEKEQSEFENPF